ncbi:hypothetical protein AK830_g2069 [Neonectria ditissima]|uniref:Glucose N-acetyltransferase 1 n=1 Tax=Neonectria ditissima TaxID=78410 RepID=A0A0P7BGH1_9HYPO|nr:hypothetical protein AK830_g2069 [Neonectria ditissima]
MRLPLSFRRTGFVYKFLGIFACVVLLLLSVRKYGPTIQGPQTPAATITDSAYVFYATQDSYACSVLVNTHLLKMVHHSNHRIVVFLSKDVSAKYHRSLKALGVEVIKEQPMPLHSNSNDYYRGCLLKLAAFRMHEIDPSLRRLVVLDADQLILRSLDKVFDLPPADFYAPSAYWIDDSFLSSTIMLIQPNAELWTKIQQTVASLPPHQYDMDVVNALFGDDAPRLPGSYVALNNHWEDWTLPPWFESKSTAAPSPSPGPSKRASDKDLEDLYVQTYVVHFTAMGKPWKYDVWSMNELKPNAHYILLRQWQEWRSTALAVCPSGFIDYV